MSMLCRRPSGSLVAVFKGLKIAYVQLVPFITVCCFNCQSCHLLDQSDIGYLILKLLSTGGPSDKPEKFLCNSSVEHFFGCQQWESVISEGVPRKLVIRNVHLTPVVLC